MPYVFTVCFCGTGSSILDFQMDKFVDGELISTLGVNLVGQKLVTGIVVDGPASGNRQVETGELWVNMPEYYKKKAQITGEGWEENVAHALAVIKCRVDRDDPVLINLASSVRDERNRIYGKPVPDIVNLIGWSRGGVSCHMLANAMFDDPELRNIKVNIFAVDPVPGTRNFTPARTSVQLNVYNYVAVYARDERSFGFAPTIPTFPGSRRDHEKDPHRPILIPMPGRHSTLVGNAAVDGAKGAKELIEPGKLVRHLAEHYLTEWGTQLREKISLNDIDILELYTKMSLDINKYKKMRSTTYLKISEEEEGERKVYIGTESSGCKFSSVQGHQYFYDSGLANVKTKFQDEYISWHHLLIARRRDRKQRSGHEEPVRLHIDESISERSGHEEPVRLHIDESISERSGHEEPVRLHIDESISERSGHEEPVTEEFGYEASVSGRSGYEGSISEQSLAQSVSTLFPHSSESTAILSSVMFSGMRVIFDQSASTYPVNLIKKTPTFLSVAQSLSNAFATIEEINWDLRPSVFETQMQENPIQTLKAKEEVPSVNGQNKSNAIIWFNTIFPKGKTTGMEPNADQDRILKEQQDFFKRHFLAMAVFGVKGGDQKEGDYKPIEEFWGWGGIPVLATLASGGGRLNYRAQNGDIGDEFFVFLTLGTSPSLNLRRGIKSQQQLDALFDGIAAPKQGTAEDFPSNLPTSPLGLYKSISTHAETIEEDGTIKEKDVWYGFQDALHFDFPVGGRGHILEDYKGRKVRTDYQGHSWAARRNQSSLTKIVGVVDEEKHYQTGSALLRHRRRENGASNTMVAFEGSAPMQDNIFGGGHGLSETIKKKLTSYQSERTLTGQSKRDKLGLPGGKGGIIAEVTEEGLAKLKDVVSKVNQMDISDQEEFFKKLLLTTTAQERRALLNQLSRSRDIPESRNSSDILERKLEFPDGNSESENVVRLHLESKNSSTNVLERKPSLPDGDSEPSSVVRLHL